MQRITLTIVIALAAILAGGCSTTPVVPADPLDPLAPLAWLTGSWESVDGESEETWLPPRGGTMFGINRSTADGRTVFFEFFRLEYLSDGSVTFFASPGGEHPPTPFVMIAASEQRVTFENQDHDFPQRITYWREKNTLHAQIAGTRNGNAQSAEWVWQLVR